MNCESILLNTQIDGSFPNHHPDPSVKENMQELRTTLLENNADIGFAYDGDADRVGVVDSSGEILKGDEILMLLAEKLAQDKKKPKMIADVKCSKALFDYVKSLAIDIKMCKTGRSLIRQELIETNSDLAGELSGHIFFGGKYCAFDDALLVSIKIINIISLMEKKLSQWKKEKPSFFSTEEIRIETTEKEKNIIIEKIKNKLKENNISEYIDIDGIRKETNDGWWLIRASQTEASLTARCEGKNKNTLEKQKQDFLSYIKGFNLDFEDIHRQLAI